jgi:hypothetical protein
MTPKRKSNYWAQPEQNEKKKKRLIDIQIYRF